MLNPAPICTAGGRKAEAEPIVSVVLEHLLAEILVPHGIGRDQVKFSEQATRCGKGRADHAVAQSDVGFFHIVDKGVHPGHGKGGGENLLTIRMQRRGILTLKFFFEPQEALDQQAARTSAGIADLLAWFRIEQVCIRMATSLGV